MRSLLQQGLGCVGSSVPRAGDEMQGAPKGRQVTPGVMSQLDGGGAQPLLGLLWSLRSGASMCPSHLEPVPECWKKSIHPSRHSPLLHTPGPSEGHLWHERHFLKKQTQTRSVSGVEYCNAFREKQMGVATRDGQTSSEKMPPISTPTLLNFLLFHVRAK